MLSFPKDCSAPPMPSVAVLGKSLRVCNSGDSGAFYAYVLRTACSHFSGDGKRRTAER